MGDIAAILKQALSSLKHDDRDGRLRIYRAARGAIDKLPPDTRNRYFDAFSRAVAEIEGEFAARDTNPQGGSATVPEESNSLISPANVTTKVDRGLDVVAEFSTDALQNALAGNDLDRAPDSMPVITEDVDRSVETGLNLQASDEKPSGSHQRLPVIIAIALVAFAGVVWLFFNGSMSGQSLLNGDDTPADQEYVASRPDSERVIFSSSLDGDFGSFQPQKNERISFVAGERALSATGRVVLIGTDFIEINTDRLYRLTFEVRFSEGNELSKPTFYAGFATFDESRTLETKAPGTHRYFAANGQITPELKLGLGKWQTVSGIITGVDSTTNAFRETSRYAKPILLLNYLDPAGETLIRNVKVFEIE